MTKCLILDTRGVQVEPGFELICLLCGTMSGSTTTVDDLASSVVISMNYHQA